MSERIPVQTTGPARGLDAGSSRHTEPAWIDLRRP
jgi:hypothetical protein